MIFIDGRHWSKACIDIIYWQSWTQLEDAAGVSSIGYDHLSLIMASGSYWNRMENWNLIHWWFTIIGFHQWEKPQYRFLSLIIYWWSNRWWTADLLQHLIHLSHKRQACAGFESFPLIPRSTNAAVVFLLLGAGVLGRWQLVVSFGIVPRLFWWNGSFMIHLAMSSEIISVWENYPIRANFKNWT